MPIHLRPSASPIKEFTANMKTSNLTFTLVLLGLEWSRVSGKVTSCLHCISGPGLEDPGCVEGTGKGSQESELTVTPFFQRGCVALSSTDATWQQKRKTRRSPGFVAAAQLTVTWLATTALTFTRTQIMMGPAAAQTRLGECNLPFTCVFILTSLSPGVALTTATQWIQGALQVLK